MKHITTVRESVKRDGSDYRGVIRVWDGPTYLFMKTSPNRRLSRGDAMQDARQMATDLLTENGLMALEQGMPGVHEVAYSMMHD
jgi:hypothetical protein